MFVTERARRELGWVVGLTGLFCWVYWPVLGGGQTFCYRDTMAYYYPQAILTSEAWRAGELPLWEPRIGMGYPYHADPHSMIAYPPASLFLMFPASVAYGAFVALHVWMAGVTMFGLLRHWRLAAPAAATGACALMLSGFTVSSTSLTTLLRGLAWTPAVLWAFDRWLGGASRAALGGAALLLALEGSGTDPNYVLYTWVLMALLPWLRPQQGCRTIRAALTAAVAVGLMACLLLAYQYLPLGKLIADSTRAVAAAAERGRFDIAPLNLYNLALRTPYPQPSAPEFSASFSGGQVPFFESLYFGLPVLALAVAACGWCRTPRSGLVSQGAIRSSCVWSLAAVAAWSLCLALGENLPVARWTMTLIPPLEFFRYPVKYFLMTTVTLSMLAGLGAQGLCTRRRDCLMLWKAGLITGFVFCLAAGLYACLEDTGFSRRFLSPEWSGTGGATDRLVQAVNASWLLQSMVGSAQVFSMCALTWGVARRFLTLRWAVAAGLLLITLDLGESTRRSLIVRPRHENEVRPEAAKLASNRESAPLPVRYVGYPRNEIPIGSGFTLVDSARVERALMEGLTGALFGCDSMLGLLSVRTGLENVLAVMMMQASGRPERDSIAARCGAELVLSAEGMGNVPGTTRMLGTDGPVVIRGLEGVSPRVFLAARAEPMSSPSMQAVSAAILALPDRVYYQPAGSAVHGRLLQPSEIGASRLVSYRRNRLEVAFDLKGEGLLVLLEKYNSGWRGWVDGQERPVLKAGGVFRGIEVHEGERRMVMEYMPFELRLGGLISVGALLGLLGFLVGSIRRDPCSVVVGNHSKQS